MKNYCFDSFLLPVSCACSRAAPLSPELPLMWGWGRAARPSAANFPQGNPIAIVGGAAGGVLLGEGLHYANSKLNDQSYQTGYDKGRSDAVKQQYWLYVSMQQAKAGDEGRVRLYEVHLPEQTIDGVIFKPTTQFLRIEGGGTSQ